MLDNIQEDSEDQQTERQNLEYEPRKALKDRIIYSEGSSEEEEDPNKYDSDDSEVLRAKEKKKVALKKAQAQGFKLVFQ